jgi:putative ATP-dependent endonuclease of OLD family
MVEGWSEEILMPALATRMRLSGIIPKDLTEAGVSIVNVGSTAFLRYAKIFWRKCGPEMPVPVAVVTDVDVPAYEKAPKPGSNGMPEKDPTGKTLCDYLPRDSSQAEAAQAVAGLEKKLSSLFVAALKAEHPRLDDADIERELARKLIDGTLDKTGMAHRLAQTLTDSEVSVDLKPSSGDPWLGYLMEAIKHATGC